MSVATVAGQFGLMVLLGVSLAACKPAPQSDARVAAAPQKSAYFCAPGYDYRAFEGSEALSNMETYAPLKEQTLQQKIDMEPIETIWRLQQTPRISCTSDHRLQLHYADTRAKSFATASNRLTITIAPAGKLLDPILYKRASDLAVSLYHTQLSLARSECWPSTPDCKKIPYPDPLVFPSYNEHMYLAYHPFTEFANTVFENTKYNDRESSSYTSRKWHWSFKRNGFFVQRIIVTTKDEKFDISTEMEWEISKQNKPFYDGTDGFHLVAETIAYRYYEALVAKTTKAQGARK